MSVSKAYCAIRREQSSSVLLPELEKVADRSRTSGDWLVSTFPPSLLGAVERQVERSLGDASVVVALGRVQESLFAELRLFGCVPVRLLVNHDAALEYLSADSEQFAQAERSAEVASLARTWAAAHTGADVSTESIQRLIDTPHTFADDAFHGLLEILGLPAAEDDKDERFGEMVGSPYDAAYVLPGGRKIRYGDLRFVLGKGRDFHGLWDKADPAAPVARFPPNGKGWRDSRKEWAARLNTLPAGEWFMD